MIRNRKKVGNGVQLAGAASITLPLRIYTGKRTTEMTRDYAEQRNGVYYLIGTRITLDSLVDAFREGASPETIRDDFPSLTLAQVYGALAFYLEHQAGISQYLLTRQQRWQAMEQQATPPANNLEERLARVRLEFTLGRD